MRRPLFAVAAGVTAIALAVPLVLLGRAVLATPDRATSTGAFDRAADWLLGVRNDDAFFKLARAYRRAIADPESPVDSATPVKLATLARRIGPRTERAQAHLMVGAIFALPAGNGSISFGRMRQFGGGPLLDQATQEFREAAMLDERNEAAKYDLELVLRSQTPAFEALSKRRLSAPERPNGRNNKQGQDTKHPRTKRRLKQGGVYGSGSGY
jgi:hypothetical protein